MHKLEEWLVSAIMSMYTGVKTVVRTVYGNSSMQIAGIGTRGTGTCGTGTAVLGHAELGQRFWDMRNWDSFYSVKMGRLLLV